MKLFDRLVEVLPRLLSSRVSVYIYIFLFFYLVLLGILGLFLPQIEPSNTVQLIFGNYTNVLSALGASLAAGFGYKHVKHNREMGARNDELQASLHELHRKVDELSKKK